MLAIRGGLDLSTSLARFYFPFPLFGFPLFLEIPVFFSYLCEIFKFMTNNILNTQIMKNLLIAFIGLLLIASCKKKDESIAVDGVAIPPTATVAVNLTVKLTPTVTPENAADKSVTWTSSDPNIAAVADDGTVTGKSAGTAVITAASKSNPDKSARCEVTVTAVAVDGVAIPPTATVEVNLTVKLIPIVTPENATDKSVTWASSDANIAAVADDGTVTGKSAGTAFITVASKSNPDKSARCEVTVTAVAVDGVTIPLTTATVDVNLTVKLTPTVTPENATDKSVTWTSSDANIATVADDGTVTGKSSG